MKVETRHRICFIFGDLIACLFAMLAFNLFRYNWLYGNSDVTFSLWSADPAVAGGYIVFPLAEVLIFAVLGFYNSPDFKSRFELLSNSVSGAFIGSLLIYFVIMVNDNFHDRMLHYSFLLMLFVSFAVPVLIERCCVDALLRRRRQKGLDSYNVLVVGSNPQTSEYAAKLERHNASMGYRVVGIVGNPRPDTSGYDWPVYDFDELAEVIKRDRVKVCVLTLQGSDKDCAISNLNRLFALDVGILMPLEGYNLATSRPRLSNVIGEPLVDITASRLSPCMTNLKRISDVMVSIIALTLLIPLFAILAVAIKIDSAGPVIYRQERVGLHRRKFRIYKFRSMIVNSEPEGPRLSSADDTRVTRLGHFMRKYRIDELPQFWNVLRGDMSLVGPRPEREYYFSKLCEDEPAINMLCNIRPGITSFGSVKFGYAINIEQMKKRMYFDLVYLESISFSMDLKILFHTVSTVFTGKGV